MNDQQRKQVIESLAEDLVKDDVNLWPAIRQHFKQNNKPSKQGDLLMKTNRSFKSVVTALLALLVLALLFFLTPQGQVLAQQMLQFFTRANSDVLPLQPWQQTAPANAENPTADPASILDAHASIQAVEQQAGFIVLVPAHLPETLQFSGASYDPQGKITRIFYRLIESNGLVLRQEPSNLSEKCELCGEVGASAAIQNVTINGQPGEYVEGTWNLTDAGPVWKSDPYLKTLRWKSNNMAFELMFMGPPEELSQAEMVAIATSMK
jgi:hypothetical protein